MGDDSRDFIERVESANEKLNGKPMPLDEMAENFALYGLKKRAAALESFDAELRGELRADFQHLRRWRKSVEQAQSYTFKAVITVIVTGFVGAVWLGIKVMLGK